MTSSYDASARQLTLTVKQTQRAGGTVGVFDVPMEVVIATGERQPERTIRISKAEETFNFPVNSAPLTCSLTREAGF